MMSFLNTISRKCLGFENNHLYIEDWNLINDNFYIHANKFILMKLWINIIVRDI